MLAGKRIDAGPFTRAGRKAQRIRDPLICLFQHGERDRAIIAGLFQAIPLLKSLAVDLVAYRETLA
jgi:hypothetical protein